VPGFYGTAPQYATAFRRQFGHVPDSHNAAASAASLALAYAMQNARSTDPTAVRNALAQLNVTTFFGEIRFDARGANVYKPMVVSQVQYGKLVTIYPAKNAQRSKNGQSVVEQSFQAGPELLTKTAFCQKLPPGKVAKLAIPTHPKASRNFDRLERWAFLANMVERLFRDITTQAIRRGVFRSVRCPGSC
jgi:hypothetical protein